MERRGRPKLFDRRKIIPRPGDLVKARIVAAGVQLQVLARRARLTSGTLSSYIQGRARNRDRQEDIWQAFRSLSGSRVTLRTFWGELLSERDEEAA